MEILLTVLTLLAVVLLVDVVLIIPIVLITCRGYVDGIWWKAVPAAFLLFILVAGFSNMVPFGVRNPITVGIAMIPAALVVFVGLQKHAELSGKDLRTRARRALPAVALYVPLKLLVWYCMEPSAFAG